MTAERSFIVTVIASFRAEVAVLASSEAEAARKAREGGTDSGELLGPPQRLSAQVCDVRALGFTEDASNV